MIAPFQLGVLVPEVVDVPGFVPDDQVVQPLLHDLLEHHEVGHQDLVHPSERLEAVQVVLAGLRRDVGRLVGQPGAGGVDALALGLEDARHGMLGQPVDLQLRAESLQLLDHGDVAAGMAEPDRRREVQRPLGPAQAACPELPAHGFPLDAVDERLDQPVDLDRLAALGQMARTLHHHEIAHGQLGQSLAPRHRLAPVLGAVDDEGGTPNAPAQRLGRLPVLRCVPAFTLGDHRLGIGLEGPRDRVLVLLGGVRLRQQLAEEEPRPRGVVLPPEVAVAQSPAGGVVDLVRPGLGRLRPVPVARSKPHGRCDGDDTRHPVGVLDGQSQGPRHGMAVGHDDRPGQADGVEDCELVREHLVRPVGRAAGGPARRAVPPWVDGDDGEVAGQEGDEALPRPGVADGRGRDEQQPGLSRPDDLVGHLDAVALDDVGPVGLARSHRRVPSIAQPTGSSATSSDRWSTTTRSSAGGTCIFQWRECTSEQVGRSTSVGDA
jgi:hypothetical protein